MDLVREQRSHAGSFFLLGWSYYNILCSLETLLIKITTNSALPWLHRHDEDKDGLEIFAIAMVQLPKAGQHAPQSISGLRIMNMTISGQDADKVVVRFNHRQNVFIIRCDELMEFEMRDTRTFACFMFYPESVEQKEHVLILYHRFCQADVAGVGSTSLEIW